VCYRISGHAKEIRAGLPPLSAPLDSRPANGCLWAGCFPLALIDARKADGPLEKWGAERFVSGDLVSIFGGTKRQNRLKRSQNHLQRSSCHLAQNSKKRLKKQVGADRASKTPVQFHHAPRVHVCVSYLPGFTYSALRQRGQGRLEHVVINHVLCLSIRWFFNGIVAHLATRSSLGYSPGNSNMDQVEIRCTACRHTMPLALACEHCGKNVSPLRRNISNEVRGKLNALIDAEAEMLRRMNANAIADWIGGSPARRTRVRRVFNYPKGWKLRRGRPSRRVYPIDLPPLK
jgi:hypothetical protein